jgi:hypothetical protein
VNLFLAGPRFFAKQNSLFRKVVFSRQNLLLYFGKENFGGKKLLFKRVNLLCKEGFSFLAHFP